ncbi:MAG: AsmA family protein [Rhodospirillaceae bacterium]|nr:AsmA family protein [Rhodospirillaceae bacterium]
MLGLLRRLISLSLKLGVLAAGIGAIIGYANLSDLESWKKDLQAQVMQVSGRRLHIDGPIDFKVTMPPQIIARGVRLENAKWGRKGDMLKAERLVAEVDFLPLMLGDVAVPRLRLEGAEILIEVARNGKTNWDELNSLETAAGGSPAPPGGFPNLGTVVSPGGISIFGGQVTVTNAAKGVTTAFNLPNIDLGLGALNPCF